MKEVTPNEALNQIQNDPQTIYLDVRSIPEFEQGHPMRAINIPLLHFLPGMGMMPNEDFQRIIESNLPKDATLLIGCKTGGRSAKACEILEALGYSKVANVRGGFIGVMDQMGRVTEPGWSLLNFPVCTSCTEDARYETLAAKANKKS